MNRLVLLLTLTACAPVVVVDAATDPAADGGGGSASTPPPGPSTCSTLGLCEYDPQSSVDAEADCHARNDVYQEGAHCPTTNLLGCCGDLARYGGPWQCYYFTVPKYCETWQTVAP